MFNIGDTVEYHDEYDNHKEFPEWYPPDGTLGIIKNVTEDNCDVQWEKGSTSSTDRWWAPIESLKLF